MKTPQYIRQAQYKKGFIVPLLLILIALLLVGGGAYLYTQQKQANLSATGNVVSPQATSPQMTNWKTYTSAERVITFKYPEYLHITEGRPGSASSGMILLESSKPGETGLEIVLGRTEKETEPNRSLWVSAGTTNIGGYPATKWSRSAVETEFVPSTIFYYFITAKNVTIALNQKTSGLSQADVDGILASFTFLK